MDNALPEHHTPGVIHADDVKHQLRDVDAKYADLVCHGTCHPWMNGCDDATTILTYRSRTEKKRVHFIRTIKTAVHRSKEQVEAFRAGSRWQASGLPRASFPDMVPGGVSFGMTVM